MSSRTYTPRLLTATELYRNLMATDRNLDTKAALAEFMGVEPTQVSQWEHRRGNKVPDRIKRRLVERYGYSREWLDYGTGPVYRREFLEQARGEDPLGERPPTPEELEAFRKIQSSPRVRAVAEKLLTLSPQKVALVEAMVQGLPPNGDHGSV